MKYKYIALIIFLSTSAFSQVGQKFCDQNDPMVINTHRTPIKKTETFIHKPYSDPPSNFIENRIIFWVHGLAGSSESWAVASDAVRDNKNVVSLLPTYSEFSLDVAGGELHDNQLVPLGIPNMIQNNVDDPMDNFIIAHSQGGLVSRATDRFYIDKGYANEDRMFGGIATFGSPHAGAQIINNIPDIKLYAADGTKALKDGPLLEELSDLPWYLDIIIPEEKVIDALDELSDFVGDIVLPFALSNFQAGITDDYAVGSPALADLNSTPHFIPAAAFHGIEDDPVVWRTLYSLQHNPNNEPAFGANYDEKFIEYANENALSWEMKYLAYEELEEELSSDGCPWWLWVFKPIACLEYFVYDDVLNLDEIIGISENEARDISYAYYKGWQWWLNANDNYKILIGAIEFVESGTAYECHCIKEDYYGTPIDSWTTTVYDPDDCGGYNGPVDCRIIDEIIEYTPVEHESDGVVLASSAMAYPGADVGPDNALIGSNHFQMRNDKHLKEKLKELFEGKHGKYFKTN